MTSLFPVTFPGTQFGEVVVEHDGFSLYTVVSRVSGGEYFITSNVVRDGAVSQQAGSAPVSVGYASRLLWGDEVASRIEAAAAEDGA